jgi:hypothetical protein
MKPYGVNPKIDQDCCPGHSRYPRDTYNTNISQKAQTRDTAIAHRVERHKVKNQIRVFIATGKELEINTDSRYNGVH